MLVYLLMLNSVLLSLILIILWCNGYYVGKGNCILANLLEDSFLKVEKKLKNIDDNLDRIKSYLDSDIDSEHPAYKLKHGNY